MAAITATLSDFSAEVVEYVTDPRTGIQSRLKWLPTVAEVRMACEDRKAHLKSLGEIQRKVAALEAKDRMTEWEIGYLADLRKLLEDAA